MKWAIGIDIGGTKIDVACIDTEGKILLRKKFPTRVAEGADEVINDIVTTVQEFQNKFGESPAAIGVGMAGQIAPGSGVVKFAPNLKWQNVPLQNNLSDRLDLPVAVTNDVRAATWGEWIHGAGQSCDNLVCLFIGTGIGGGIVANGEIMSGSNNSAGELGHTVVKINGPLCTCGNLGCLEAIAGGWAVAKQAKACIAQDPKKGEALLKLVSHENEIIAQHVLKAAENGDPLAHQIVEEVIAAITVGCESFVNAFNPERLILGGGLGMALPNLIERVKTGVQQKSLRSATEHLEILPAKLQNDAGVIGAAAFALQIY